MGYLQAQATGLLVLLCAACSADTSLPKTAPVPDQGLQTANGAPAGVPEGFNFLYDSSLRTTPTPAALDDIPFTAITLSRSGCEGGNCPVYVVAFRLDGTASYEGVAAVDRIGRFAGQVSFFDFAQLALLAERAHFIRLDDHYRSGAQYDGPVASVIIRTRSGDEKTVVDSGALAPPELWTLQRAIDGVAAGIKWTEIPK